MSAKGKKATSPEQQLLAPEKLTSEKCQNRTWRTRESWPAKLTDFPGFAGGCGVMPRSPLSE
jgi:hypothetical protein